MKTTFLIAALGFTALAALPASALTLTNYDAVSRSLTVIQNGVETATKIEPETELSGVCSGACQLKLEGSEDLYEFAGNVQLSIEEGVLYDNTEEDFIVDEDSDAADTAAQ